MSEVIQLRPASPETMTLCAGISVNDFRHAISNVLAYLHKEEEHFIESTDPLQPKSHHVFVAMTTVARGLGYNWPTIEAVMREIGAGDVG